MVGQAEGPTSAHLGARTPIGTSRNCGAFLCPDKNIIIKLKTLTVYYPMLRWYITLIVNGKDSSTFDCVTQLLKFSVVIHRMCVSNDLNVNIWKQNKSTNANRGPSSWRVKACKPDYFLRHNRGSEHHIIWSAVCIPFCSWGSYCNLILTPYYICIKNKNVTASN